jgi:hypothetical protein
LCLSHLLRGNVVKEDAGSERRWHSSTKLAVTSLQDSLGTLGEHFLSEVGVVHGQADLGEKTKDTLVVGVTDHTTEVGQGGGVGHVNGNGVSVTKRWVRDKLVKG